MTNKVLSLDMGHVLGMLGLFLTLVIARLAHRAYEPQQTAADRLTSFLARRTIDGIAAIGWVADHLPALSAPHDGARALPPSLKLRRTAGTVRQGRTVEQRCLVASQGEATLAEAGQRAR